MSEQQSEFGSETRSSERQSERLNADRLEHDNSQPTDPPGIDQPLDAGLADEDGMAAGSDAAADADPASDREQYAEAVQEDARRQGR